MEALTKPEGISSDLLMNLRRTFAKCDVFESNSNLKATFVTDQLAPYRDSLPERDNLISRVDSCIEYLFYRTAMNGTPLLKVFVKTLRDRYDMNTEIFFQLDSAIRLIDNVYNNPLIEENANSPYKLFEKILYIDFIEQARTFRSIIQSHSIASFLVHGQPDYGQQVLLTRLIRLIPGFQTSHKIKFDLGRHGVGKSIPSLLKLVAKKLELKEPVSIEQIAEKTSNWWKTENVILVFDSVDCMWPELFEELIQQFIMPLEKVLKQNNQIRQRETKFVIFLVDYAECVCDWGIKLANDPSNFENSNEPLVLPGIREFDRNIIENWIDTAGEVLPLEIDTSMLISEAELATPQLIYEKICQCCQTDWEGELAKWLQ